MNNHEFLDECLVMHFKGGLIPRSKILTSSTKD